MSLKRWISICLLAALLMTSVSAAGSVSQARNMQQTAAPVTSCLCSLDGGVMLVRYDGENVILQYFDDRFQATGSTVIAPELPIFGGFYQGTDGYFLVFGQENPDENDENEVIRVVHYSKDWERLASASLYGANTRCPFADGTLRMAQYGGYLYLHTSHLMYRLHDGMIYQSNLTLSARISDMQVTDSRFLIENNDTGYVSRSLDQFVALDGNKLITADLGNAEPRAVVLNKYRLPAGNDNFTGSCSHVEVLPIGGTPGDMETGVSLGGFIVTDSAYLVAGSSVAPSSDARSGVRNIFVTATDKNNFSNAGTNLFWLTSYADGSSSAVSSPRLIRVDGKRCLLLWNEDTSLCYVLLNDTGVPQTPVFSVNAPLPDCEPLVRGDNVLWYSVENCTPVSCSLDFANPSQEIKITQAAEDVHSCVFVPEELTAPTCESDGLQQYICHDCGKSYEMLLPAVGHVWDEGAVTVAPTQTQGGELTYTCTVCGAVQIAPLPPLGEPEHSEPAADPGSEPDPDKPDALLAQFTDLPNTSHWAYPGIAYVVEHGLFNGLSVTTFAPDAAMTRAMIVTVLWRYTGSPQGGTAPFSDVKDGSWYAEAVAWANQNSIVNGVGHGCFDPDGNVTREQLATILYRFACWEKHNTGGRAELLSFHDAGFVSSWALDAVRWAISAGIIEGSKEIGRLMLLPDGNATRAQVAAMLMRYIEEGGTQ